MRATAPNWPTFSDERDKGVVSGVRPEKSRPTEADAEISGARGAEGQPVSGRSVPPIIAALVGEWRIRANQCMRHSRTGALRGHPPQKGVRRRS